MAVALRKGLIDVSSSRLVQQGQQGQQVETKMEQVYQYLTGTKFRQRVEAVVEKFNDMRDDLDKERKFMGRQWAKRETQILAVVESTVGTVGDLQAIAGKAMPEIPSLDMPLLPDRQSSMPSSKRNSTCPVQLRRRGDVARRTIYSRSDRSTPGRRVARSGSFTRRPLERQISTPTHRKAAILLPTG